MLRLTGALWRRAASAGAAVAVGALVAHEQLRAPPPAHAKPAPDAKLRPGDRLVMSGDCGGTNTRLQLFKVPAGSVLTMGEKPPGKLVFAKKYVNSEFESFEAVCVRFLEESAPVAGPARPEACCLACAGGIVDNTVNFTNVQNRGWSIDGYKLQHTLAIPTVRLINDFEAQGYGLLTLEPHERLALNDAKPRPGAPIACIGAGTGLGECFLTETRGEYACWPSEGGHAEFSPRNQLTYDLLVYLKAKFAAHHRVSVERIVSGPGLGNVYEFLRQHWAFADRVDSAVDAEWHKAAPDAKGVAVANGAHKGDVLCLKAVEIFSECYGSEAGTVALKFLPYGGLYISGGIAAKNPQWVQGKPFTYALHDKGRMSPLLQQVPIYLVLVEDTGERGALYKAVQMLD